MEPDPLQTDTSDLALCLISHILPHIFVGSQKQTWIIQILLPISYIYTYILKKNLILSIQIWIRSDIKCLDSDTDYLCRVLTLPGQTNIRKYVLFSSLPVGMFVYVKFDI